MKPLIKVTLTLSLLLLFLQFFQDDLIFERNNINNGEWWRLLTGNLVHTNYPHLALNLAGIWISAFIFLDYMHARTYLFSLIFLAICVGIGIYFFSPELTWYAGISGVLYGLFLVGATYALLNKDFLIGIPLLTLIPIKIFWDLFNPEKQPNSELIGAPVATVAHLYGMLGAIIIIMLILFITKKTMP
jgi:rhomboid family GlyGly-CTERM serine protease